MLSKERKFGFGRERRVRVGVVAVGLLIACAWITKAEETAEPASYSSANYPVTAPPEATPSVEINQPSQTNIQSAEEPPYSAEPRRFQYNFRLTIRGVYDDNINISHSNPISDYYVAIEPEIILGFGDTVGRQENFILLDYIPSGFLYVDHSENDAVEHRIHLEGGHRFSRLTLSLSQDVNILDSANLGDTTDTTGHQVNLDVSARTRLNLYTTYLKASYDLSAKTFLTGEFNAVVYDYPNFISSEMYSGGLYLNYSYSPKLVIGFGGTGGFNFVDDPNPDQTFEQANLRVVYEATGKLSLNASGGVEFRQFENNSRGTHISPVFDIGLRYKPFDGTDITLSAGRRTLNSGFFPGQDFTATNVTISVRQRLLQRIYLGLTAGYENSDYFNTVEGVSATRRDNYFFIEPSIDITITRFWSAGVYYLHRQNDSVLDPFTFNDNQIAVRTTLHF
jgi:hypothetical protein